MAGLNIGMWRVRLTNLAEKQGSMDICFWGNLSFQYSEVLSNAVLVSCLSLWHLDRTGYLNSCCISVNFGKMTLKMKLYFHENSKHYVSENSVCLSPFLPPSFLSFSLCLSLSLSSSLSPSLLVYGFQG